jgi:hypothetical protein
VAEDDEGKEQAKGEGRDHEEIDGGDLGQMAARKVRQVGEGRSDRRRMYFAIVSSATWYPRNRSSAWMRRRPQVGFSRAIRRMRSRISLAISGRPTAGVRDFQRQ